MARIAKNTDAEYLEELKKKLDNKEYLETAVDRISWELSSEITGAADDAYNLGRF